MAEANDGEDEWLDGAMGKHMLDEARSNMLTFVRNHPFLIVRQVKFQAPKQCQTSG